MTEQDKDKTTSTETESPDVPETKASGKEKRSARRKAKADSTKSGQRSFRLSRTGAIMLIAVILLVSIGAGGYWGWTLLQQQLSTMTAERQQLAQELETVTAQLRRFENADEQTDAQWRAAVDELETLVVESAQRWNAQSNRTENRWPLEEALTLTRLAAQRLKLDADGRIAVSMLRSADSILAELDQAAVLPLRRQLAADILALESTEAADVNGLFFRLQAISDQIRNISWVPKPQTQQALPENTNPAEGFWHSLKQVVVISRLDVPMEPPALQSDFERWRQHSLLLIEQTQLALLAGNQKLFDAALTQTLEQLSLMSSQVKLTAYQEGLSGMQGAVLNPQWPDIERSIRAIETYLTGLDETSDSETTTDTATAEEDRS